MHMVKHLLLVITLLFLVFSCAIQGSIDGGPKDIKAPTYNMDKSSPKNESILFNTNEIHLKFDEFFKLNNPTTNIFIVPNNLKIDAVAKDKELILKLIGELQKETTYAIYLNNAVQDIHEGNDSLLTYVFSTGKWIDSLMYSGTILDAFKRTPLKDITVGLYSDTCTSYFQKAHYFTSTNETGNFTFKYLKSGKYKVIAFKDVNKDLVPQEHENLGFKKEFIQLDKTIKDSVPMVLFSPKPKRIIKSVTFIGPYQFIVSANETIDNATFAVEGIAIKPLMNVHRPDSISIFPNIKGKDTLKLKLFVGNKMDSAFVRLPVKDLTKTPKLYYPTLIDTTENITISASDFINKINVDSIQINGNDSIKNSYEVINKSDNSFTLRVQNKKFKNLTIKLLQNSIDFSNYKDKFSSTININYINPTSVGILNVNTSNLNKGEIVELIYNDKVVNRYIVTGTDKTYTIRNLEKGNYFFRVIKDENQNGRWDTGDFKNQQDPEQVHWYNDPIVVRPNWEVDVVFDPTKWR
jgi:uncharacterized protein (DUF2141 family)